MSTEPTIVVDGTTLNEAQAMTVRVSLTNWNFDTEDFEKLGPIGPLYRARANEVLGMMKCFLLQSAAEMHGKLMDELTTLRPASEYHEDFGDVLWWPVSDEDRQPHEAPHCGSTLEVNFPFEFDDETGALADPYESCHLFWSPLPQVKAVKV